MNLLLTCQPLTSPARSLMLNIWPFYLSKVCAPPFLNRASDRANSSFTALRVVQLGSNLIGRFCANGSIFAHLKLLKAATVLELCLLACRFLRRFFFCSQVVPSQSRPRLSPGSLILKTCGQTVGQRGRGSAAPPDGPWPLIRMFASIAASPVWMQ